MVSRTKLKPRADRRRSKAAKRGWITRKRKERVKAAGLGRYWESEALLDEYQEMMKAADPRCPWCLADPRKGHSHEPWCDDTRKRNNGRPLFVMPAQTP